MNESPLFDFALSSPTAQRNKGKDRWRANPQGTQQRTTAVMKMGGPNRIAGRRNQRTEASFLKAFVAEGDRLTVKVNRPDREPDDEWRRNS